MTVKKDDATGARYVELELELPGTPEQVWQAIATGPGISAWFAPTEVDERAGGAITFDFGPEMGGSTGVITAWEPPRRLAYEEREWMPGAPPVATEIHVETRAGGTCVMRMVHSLFTASDEWDDQLESFENGWPAFFEVLKGYLARFAGARCSQVRLTGRTTGPVDRAWGALAGALGLGELSEGGRAAASAPGAPALAGVVERLGGRGDHRDAVLRIEAPAPGFAMIGAFVWNEAAHVSLALYLYGEGAPAAAARDEPAWRAWMADHFPAVEGAPAAG